MSQNEVVELIVQVELVDSSDEEIDQETRRLRNEIVDLLDVESATLQTEQSSAPPGTKPIDPVTLGVLIVAVAPIAVTKFLEFLQAWAMRREGRTVKIKIQNAKGSLIEIEVPATTSTAEIQKWIGLIKESLVEKPTKK